jgi:phosphate transport system substrate-binding protein
MARDSRQSTGVSRRKFVIASGTAGVTALAGCAGGSGGGGGGGEGGGGGGNNGSGGTAESGGGNESGSGGSSGQLSGTIDIAGSSTVFPLATAMAERFMQEHPQVKINLQSTGSGGGFENFFCPGETDFNNASRPIQQEEKAHCNKNDVNPVELNVATDALTVIVNNNADWVDCITVEELEQIWSAESPPTNWSDVNSDWPNEPFDLFGPSEASGTYDYWVETVLGEEGPGMRGDYQATEQDRTIVQGVSQSETGLGFLGYAYYSENKDTAKALAINDDGSGCVEPSLETARAGEYTPLSRPLFTYPAQSQLANEPVAEFARFWLENSTSQEIVAKEVGYVPLSDDQQQQAMDNLEQAIEAAQSGSGGDNSSG